jgi:hypothetical protein
MAKSETTHSVLEAAEDDRARDFAELIAVPIADQPAQAAPPLGGVVVGMLVGFVENGATPMVTFPGRAGAVPVAARTTVDLHAPHIGRQVVMVFEQGNPNRPIITGCIRQADNQPRTELTGRVEVQADGERLIVSAVHGLVLRCGKASITLSPDGKIVVRGTHVVSHSSGLNRIKGGSVQVN